MASIRPTAFDRANVTECSICLEVYKDPRCLPCIHTFCLSCVKELFNQHTKTIACPLCRRIFTISADGLEKLPSNFFIKNVLEIIKASEEEAEEKAKQMTTGLLCELCVDEDRGSGDNNTPVAQWRCLDCQQNICHECSRRHNRQNISKNHSLIDVEEYGESVNQGSAQAAAAACKERRKKKVTKSDIGLPTNFRHVSHIGWDPQTGFNMDGLDPALNWLFQAAGVTNDQLTDKKTCKFIYKFIMKHGGLDAVQQEFESKTQTFRKTFNFGNES